MFKTKTKTAESKLKSKFRQSARWKKFRIFMKQKSNNKDYITGSPLPKGWQLHHKDMRIENYSNLDESRFCCIGKTNHEIIHHLYRYYIHDPAVIDRLKSILEDMKKMNND